MAENPNEFWHPPNLSYYSGYYSGSQMGRRKLTSSQEKPQLGFMQQGKRLDLGMRDVAEVK